MSEIRVDTISEKTSANGVAIDGVTIKDGGITATDGSTITTADNTDTLTLISTDADANVGPVLNLYRNSSSPADDDDAGRIHFTGNDSGGNATTYATIRTVITDVTDGTEDVQVLHKQLIGGTEVNTIRIKPDEIVINDSSIDLDFRVESNGNANMLFVDGGNDRVGVGTSSPPVPFSVHGTGPQLNLYHIGTGNLGANFHYNGTTGNLGISTNGVNASSAPQFTLDLNGKVGIGETTPLGKLHIKTADSGASANANADELVVEGNDNSGLTILSGTSGAGNIHFGDSGDNDIGLIRYSHGDNSFLFNTNANTNFGLSVRSDNKITTNAETAPDVDVGGLTLQQGAFDGHILTFKSSDVAHGVTAFTETDTWLDMLKNSDGGGGLLMRTFSETATSFRHVVVASGSNTAESTAATSYWCVDARKNADNTNVTGLAADDNLASFRQSDEAQFIIKGDGELFSNQSATVGTYDAYDDAQLVRAYDLNHMQGVINSKFDKFVQYNKNDLQKARLIGTDDEGNATPMVNVTGMQRLHNGAIWQQYEKTERLANAFYKLATKTIGKAEADKLLTEEEIQLLN
jgi:hypothetical protein